MTTTPVPTPTPADGHPDKGQDGPVRGGPGSSGHIGRIVAGSLAVGLLAALLLVLPRSSARREDDVTGAVLCGFAIGWATLAVLSVRFTDQPQRWAAVPAVFMAVGGLLLIGFGGTVREVLNWVWPPALLALVVWMFVGAHRKLRSRSRRWLLYPVLGVLALAAVGGGYETVREAVDANAYPMPGQLIDVGGHRLHLYCTGSGSPTVVLQPGGGDFSSAMAWIAPAVASQTRVCVYDRAGRGLERVRRGPPGRHPDSDRPAHVAATRRRPRALPAGRPLLRRPVRPHLRRPLPGRGRRDGAGRLHQPGHRGRPGEGNGVRRRLLRRRHGPCCSTRRGGCTSRVGAPAREFRLRQPAPAVA